MQDKKFSIIVPLYKEGYKTLPRFIQQLKEQDYKKWELIFVHNSPDDEGKKYLKKLKNVTFSELDAGYDPKLGTGNHCQAFNVGADFATGDYEMFLDPDIYLFPGILRDYKDAFDEHPDVDFVYGDYDFENGDRITGRIYNEYELRCANYISGAFPIKKSAFKGWDPSVKALQDWDMWLSAVDAGAKGYYIGRPGFSAEPSTADGISAYGAQRWEETYGIVRQKHGFPVSKTVVTSLGAPFHATRTAEFLGADTRVYTNQLPYKPHSYESIYLLGFYPLDWLGHIQLFYERGDMKKDLAGKKRIIHWIGTDIHGLRHRLSWVMANFMQRALQDPEYGFTHLAEADFTQEELAEVGIKADVVPLPGDVSFERSPLPEEFTVGIYINPTQDMYFEQKMYELAEAMPDVKFKFFGNPNKETVIEDNKEWVGWVDMHEFLPTISVLVRTAVHDGLPMGPIEAMIAGRRVITSAPIKYAVHAKYLNDEPDIESLVEQIRELKKKGMIEQEASDYWKKEMSPDTFRERMKKYL